MAARIDVLDCACEINEVRDAFRIIHDQQDLSRVVVEKRQVLDSVVSCSLVNTQHEPSTKLGLAPELEGEAGLSNTARTSQHKSCPPRTIKEPRQQVGLFFNVSRTV